MLRRWGYIAVLLIVGLSQVYGFRIVSYNVENLFDCTRDSTYDDSEFTAEGMRCWTPARYYTKREHIARTIVNIGGWTGVALVGLCEVENERCVRDLCRQNLRALPYSYVHFDSSDPRGIDVALLYRTDMFRILHACPLRVPTYDGERPTRDILYVSGTMPEGDTLHVYLCHLPSQLGGAARVSLRLRTKQVIAAHIDSVSAHAPRARIVVMGDMNSAPRNDLPGMTNLMLSTEQKGIGTYKYQGVWSCIDQFYVSASLADTVQAFVYDAPWLQTTDEPFTGYKPCRTYVGYRYQPEGYSDHLPIVLDIPDHSDSTVPDVPIAGILEDIYSQITEDAAEGSTQDFESLSDELLSLMEHPVPLNEGSYDALAELPFLSESQIGNILLKVNDMPMQSLYELQLVSGLKDYEIRNLLPFVQVGEPQPEPVYPRELVAYGRHDISLRTDARNIEGYEGSDPVYVQAKYGYQFKRQIAAGVTLRRPQAGGWHDLQYGGYVQLSNIGHLKRLVGGCYQVRFGQGLVTNQFFHTGKSSRVMLTGSGRQGLSKVSSAGSERYQGIGATFTAGRHTELSAWYSVDSNKVWHHAIGANVSANFSHLRVGVTVMEHLYSDSLPVRNTYYNQAYFRGRHQLVAGADVRYSWRWVYVFAELAAAENSRWGVGGIAGVRLTPLSDLGIVAMYRYYSPTFDNRYGYALSETSRLGDEHGGYIGVEYKGLKRWHLSAYGDVFRFAGPKYGIRRSGTLGYDVSGQADYLGRHCSAMLQLRSRSKGDLRTHRARLEVICPADGWRFRSRADLSLVQNAAQTPALTWGVSVCQDIEYHVRAIPMVLQLRLQGFDVRNWNNRIYTYENDVLYAFSIPATYGLGGRWYMNARYNISRLLSLYLRVSQTVYHPSWIARPQSSARSLTRSDIHLLLRVHL